MTMKVAAAEVFVAAERMAYEDRTEDFVLSTLPRRRSIKIGLVGWDGGGDGGEYDRDSLLKPLCRVTDGPLMRGLLSLLLPALLILLSLSE